MKILPGVLLLSFFVAAGCLDSAGDPVTDTEEKDTQTDDDTGVVDSGGTETADSADCDVSSTGKQFQIQLVGTGAGNELESMLVPDTDESEADSLSMPKNCAYVSDMENTVIEVTAGADTDGTFVLENQGTGDSVNCERIGCDFACGPLWIFGMDVDGDIENDPTPRYATIDYSLNLSGNLSNPDSKTAFLDIHCTGTLCNQGEGSCRLDISEFVSW